MALREEFTRSGNRSLLTQRFWGVDLHYEVADLTWFKSHGMIGPPKSEKVSMQDRPFVNYPVNMVTDFQKNAGDRLTLPLFEQFETTEATTYYGAETLVDNEQNFTFRNLDVYINLERTGAAWLGKMSEIRGGHNLKEVGSTGLKLWQVQRHDDAIFQAIYDGYNLGVTSAQAGALGIATITHPNIYPAGDAPVMSELDSGDVMNAAYLENLQVEANTLNIPQCKFAGYDGVWPLLIHAYQWRTLRADPAWKAEVGAGQFRGDKNPLFASALGMYAGILPLLVPGLNKIKTATATEAGQKNTFIRKAILLGANAIFYAVKQDESRIIPRNEYDYENKNGLAIQSIYGTAAAHWDADPTGTRINQSSILCPTWAPNPRSALVA